MKDFVAIFISVLLVVLLCEFIYWTTTDWVIFNVKALDYGVDFLYYSAGPILALGLSFTQSRFFERIPVFVNRFVLTLTNVYVLFTLLQLYADYCDENKNLSVAYTSLNIGILLAVGYLIIFKIIPKMESRGYLIVAISTLLLAVDLLFLDLGFRVFYPGFWG